MSAGRPSSVPAADPFKEAKKLEAADLLEIARLRALGYSFSWSEYGFKVAHADDPLIAQRFTMGASGKGPTERVPYRQANLSSARAAAEEDLINRSKRGKDDAKGD